MPPAGMPGGGGRGAISIPLPKADFVLQSASLQQSIDGFGASTSFASPFTTTNADLLFTTAGLGLSIMRDKISPTGWPQVLPLAPLDDQSDEIDTDFTVLQSLVARGVAIWANVWWFPTAWTGGSGTGSLDPTHYSDASALITTYLDRAWAASVPIRAVGFNNEPDITPSGYNQTAWTTTQALAYVKTSLYAALQAWGAANPTWQAATGLTAPGIVVSNVANWADNASWVTAFEGDATALSEIAYYGTHQYFGGAAYAPGAASKPIWQTEYSDQTDVAWTDLLVAGIDLGQRVHDALTIGNATAWHAWWVESVWAMDNEGLIGNVGDGSSNGSKASWDAPTYTKRAFALGNWAKFVRPGWVRIGTSGSKSGLQMTAFKKTSTGDFAIVVLNNTGSPITTSFRLNGLSSPHVAPYVTTDTAVGANASDGNLSQGCTAYGVPTLIALTAGVYFSGVVPPGVTTFVSTA